MKLRAIIGRAEPAEAQATLREAQAEAVRHARRLDVARRTSVWTELEEVDLVPRGPRGAWLVSASTDKIYARHRGVVFASHSATVIADRTALSF